MTTAAELIDSTNCADLRAGTKNCNGRTTS